MKKEINKLFCSVEDEFEAFYFEASNSAMTQRYIFRTKFSFKIISILLIQSLILLFTLIWRLTSVNIDSCRTEGIVDSKYVEETWTKSFEGFNNVTGADRFIVPNIIHFIRFNLTEYSFIDYVVIKAAMRNHRPDYFYIHTDVAVPGNFTGRYWNLIQKDPELWSRIRLLTIKVDEQIFGQVIPEEWRYFHGGDLARIRILQKYGGIYLDNDVYVIQNLDKYRKFECAINWKQGEPALGTQVIIAHKNARFLALWLDSYREYHSDSWYGIALYYNAGEKPVTEILIPHPELIHRVNGRFNSEPDTALKIYDKKDYNWRRLDTTHLLIRWQFKKFNEETINTNKYPFGQMVREVLNDSPGSNALLD